MTFIDWFKKAFPHDLASHTDGQRVDNLEGDLSDTTDRVESLESNVSDLGTNLNNLSTSVSSLSSRVTTLEDEVHNLNVGNNPVVLYQRTFPSGTETAGVEGILTRDIDCSVPDYPKVYGKLFWSLYDVADNKLIEKKKQDTFYNLASWIASYSSSKTVDLRLEFTPDPNISLSRATPYNRFYSLIKGIGRNYFKRFHYIPSNKVSWPYLSNFTNYVVERILKFNPSTNPLDSVCRTFWLPSDYRNLYRVLGLHNSIEYKSASGRYFFDGRNTPIGSRYDYTFSIAPNGVYVCVTTPQYNSFSCYSTINSPSEVERLMRGYGTQWATALFIYQLVLGTSIRAFFVKPFGVDTIVIPRNDRIDLSNKHVIYAVISDGYTKKNHRLVEVDFSKDSYAAINPVPDITCRFSLTNIFLNWTAAKMRYFMRIREGNKLTIRFLLYNTETGEGCISRFYLTSDYTTFPCFKMVTD